MYKPKVYLMIQSVIMS